MSSFLATTTFIYLHISPPSCIHRHHLSTSGNPHASFFLCLLTRRFQVSKMPNDGLPPQHCAQAKGDINQRRLNQPHPCIPFNQHPPGKHATMPGSQRPHLCPMSMQSLQQRQEASPAPKNPTSKQAHYIQPTSMRAIHPRPSGAQLRASMGHWPPIYCGSS